MIGLLIAAGLILLYLVIGCLVAWWLSPAEGRRIRKEDLGYLEGIPDEFQDRDGKHRNERRAKLQRLTVVNILIWPWMLLARLITSALNRFVDHGGL